MTIQHKSRTGTPENATVEFLNPHDPEVQVVAYRDEFQVAIMWTRGRTVHKIVRPHGTFSGQTRTHIALDYTGPTPTVTAYEIEALIKEADRLLSVATGQISVRDSGHFRAEKKPDGSITIYSNLDPNKYETRFPPYTRRARDAKESSATFLHEAWDWVLALYGKKRGRPISGELANYFTKLFSHPDWDLSEGAKKGMIKVTDPDASEDEVDAIYQHIIKNLTDDA